MVDLQEATQKIKHSQLPRQLTRNLLRLGSLRPTHHSRNSWPPPLIQHDALVGDAGAMLAALKSIYLEMKDVKLAAALNITEIRGLDNISNLKNESTLPTTFICSEHITTFLDESSNQLQHPGSHPTTAIVYTLKPRRIS